MGSKPRVSISATFKTLSSAWQDDWRQLTCTMLLSLAIIILPFGHALGTLVLLALVLVGGWGIKTKFFGEAGMLGVPLTLSYCLIVGAELLSSNPVAITLETAANYFPLVLTPIVYGITWRWGITLGTVIRAIAASSILMFLMALVEVGIGGQWPANGNLFERIALDPTHFGLVAFLYASVLLNGFFINKIHFLNPIPRWLLLVAIACCFACVLLSSTKSIWLVFGLVTVFVALYLAFASQRRWLPPTLLVVIAISGALLFTLVPVQAVLSGLGLQLEMLFDHSQPTGLFATRLSGWLAGISLGNSSPIFGVGNANEILLARDFIFLDWKLFLGQKHFYNGYVEHYAAFGLMGLLGFLILIVVPLTVQGPSWVRLFAASLFFGTSIYSMVNKFLDHDVTSAVMLVIWLTLMMVQKAATR